MLTKNYEKDITCLERLIQEINNSAITIALDLANTYTFGTQITITFKTDLSIEEWVICDNIISEHTGAPIVQPQTFYAEVTTQSEIICAWACMVNFFNNNALASMQYFEMPNSYYIWIEYRLQKLLIPSLVKNTDDCNDFEANYKHKCNLAEAPKVRITTCKIGRKLHDRYISLTTASQDTFDNTNYNYEDYGDVTYKMYKWVNEERVLTTIDLEAEETWIEFMPSWNYEISSGSIDLPAILPGDNDNLWELHVIAAPDVAVENGGSIELIANPRIKFKKGKTITVDSSMHPAEMLYSIYNTNKILFILTHPAGQQAEFQINLKLYK